MTAIFTGLIHFAQLAKSNTNSIKLTITLGRYLTLSQSGQYHYENHVTVYGSSKVRPGDNDYETAVEVGRKLAEAGYAVMTGGYYGVMEAISKGANECWRTCHR